MKRYLLCCAVLTALYMVLPSCQKEVLNSEKIKELTIDTTLKAGTDFMLDLSAYGDEGDRADIIDQSAASKFSTLENETDMFTTVYHYKAPANFTGRDSVTIAISQNPAGRAVCSKDSTILYLKFTIQ
jgi:hypothetical protein